MRLNGNLEPRRVKINQDHPEKKLYSKEINMLDEAQSRALAIPEIVTSIFRQMDMRTLLIAQRVCQKWRDLVCITKSLQQDLFLQPIGHGHELSDRVDNPLLAEAFPSVFGSRLRERESKGSLFGLTDLHWEKNSAVQEMFIRPEASWRRMLTHQPPLYHVGTFQSYCHPFGWGWTQSRANFTEDGLRMAPLFEFLIDRHWPAWSGVCIEIYHPDSAPKNSAAGAFEPKLYDDQSSGDQAREDMINQFDLVLEVRKISACTDEYDWEEEREDREKKAREQGVELPDIDSTVWKRISECYLKLGMVMAGFEMEVYHKVSGMWD